VLSFIVVPVSIPVLVLKKEHVIPSSSIHDDSQLMALPSQELYNYSCTQE